VYRFFAKHILHDPDAEKISEKNADVPNLQNMLALWGRPMPAGALTYDEIYAEWKHRGTPADARETLRLALAAAWPEDAALDQAERGFHDGKGMPAVVVGGSLSDAPAGRPSLLVAPAPPRDHSARNFLTFNKSDDALRVQEILAALAWMHKKYPGTIELVGVGTAAGVQAEFAAAVAPIALKLRVDVSAFHGTDADFLQYFNVPGIQTAGGFAAAERLTSSLK
jgi:hypothetical protein